MRQDPLLTAVPPAPVRSLSELYAIAFDRQKRLRSVTALSPGESRKIFGRCVASSTCLRHASAIVPTICRRPALPPAASVPICPICAGRRLISFRPRRSPKSRIPVWRRHTPRGRSRFATANAPSCSGPTSSRSPKTPRCGWLRRGWRAKHCPTAICCVASVGSPGGRRGRPAPVTPRRPIAESRGTRIGGAAGKSASQGHHRLVTPIVPRATRLTPDHGSCPAAGAIPDAAGRGRRRSRVRRDRRNRRRALRRAEQLSNIYLEEADRAGDQGSMELAQKLAAQSIMRLAGLRNIASVSASR